MTPEQLLNAFGKRPICGIELCSLDTAAAARTLADRSLAGTAGAVVLVNAYTIDCAEHLPGYRQHLESAWLRLADGLPLQWFSSLRGDTPRIPQVRGADLMRETLRVGSDLGLRHYLLGSTPTTVGKLKNAIASEFKTALIVGAESRPFRAMTSDELTAEQERIAEAGAHIVWLAIGTPRQDPAAVKLSTEAGVACGAVGAAFDFLAGTTHEAPRAVQALGLEWFFRLVSEPRRLWRRYLISSARFPFTLARHWRSDMRKRPLD